MPTEGPAPPDLRYSSSAEVTTTPSERETVVNLLRDNFCTWRGRCRAASPATQYVGAGYPSEPVRWVVPFPPGGPAEILARLFGQFMSERSGQLRDRNRPGAGGKYRTEAVVRSPLRIHNAPCHNANAIMPRCMKRLHYNFIRDIAGRRAIACLRCLRSIQMVPSIPFPHSSPMPRKSGRLNMAVGRQWHHPARRGRDVQNDDRRKPPTRSISWAGSALTDHWRAGAGMFRQQCGFDRAHPRRRFRALRHARRRDPTCTAAPTCAIRYRLRASAWYGVAMPANTPQAKRRQNQRGECNAALSIRDQGPAPGPGRRHPCRFGGRFRQAYRRRNGEMGQGGQVLAGISRVIRALGWATHEPEVA